MIGLHRVALVRSCPSGYDDGDSPSLSNEALAVKLMGGWRLSGSISFCTVTGSCNR